MESKEDISPKDNLNNEDNEDNEDDEVYSVEKLISTSNSNSNKDDLEEDVEKDVEKDEDKDKSTLFLYSANSCIFDILIFKSSSSK